MTRKVKAQNVNDIKVKAWNIVKLIIIVKNQEFLSLDHSYETYLLIRTKLVKNKEMEGDGPSDVGSSWLTVV